MNDTEIQRMNDAISWKRRYEELVQQIRKVGARIPCTTGGTFENDPPDAIVDACWRECHDAKVANARLRETSKICERQLEVSRGRRDDAEAEVARLREELDWIYREATGALNNAFPDEAPDILEHIGSRARAALAEKETKL